MNQEVEVNLISLASIAGIDSTPNDLITRDALIHQIEKILEQNDVVFVQGDEGVGKSTLLLDFVHQKPFNTISHFVDKNYNFSYSFSCLLDTLYRQVYYYAYGKECAESNDIDISLLNSVQSQLYRKIRQRVYKKESLYFVFDGFDNLTIAQLELLNPLFDNLPWGAAKFIFTGSQDFLSVLFKEKKLNTLDFQVINFSINETRNYFKSLDPTEENVISIHRLANKGLPSKLKEIKLLCADQGLSTFFNTENLNENTNFFELHWKKVDYNDEILINILSLITFNDLQLNVDAICEILTLDINDLNDKISGLTFLELNSEAVKFQTTTLKEFSRKKLKSFETATNEILIEFYENKIDDDNSKFNLPNLYRKAQQWEKLTSFFDLDTFIHLLGRHQTMGNLNSQLNSGLEASKKLTSKFNEAKLRFAIHKSSIKDLEKHQLGESEIEARIALGDYEQALLLANSPLLKEDRLQLLCVLAKESKIKGAKENEVLLTQIRDLYDQIDFSKIREKGFEIAGLLIYSDLTLAINLVEKITDNSSGKNSLDYAYTYLMLYASEANKRNKANIADLDTLNAKIQDSNLKNISTALRFLSDEYTFTELLVHIEKLSSFSEKLFLLKSWITNNLKSKDIYVAIKYTLEEIVRASSDNVPNASSLAEISEPLPYIEDSEQSLELILLFDVHRHSITTPTKDFIKLQLIIAETLCKKDFDKATDRI
ncbi:hypothetical protein, partial [Chryseobacterium aquaticum]|uniref:hypothetical protein n=1 Tax=Chryseobacterium aquaticum TaxID=452084 RepID=UPI002FCA2315